MSIRLIDFNKMIIKPYDNDLHLSHLSHFLSQRKMPVDLILNDIPKHGFIVFTEEQMPVAAGFLRLVEGDYCLFDSFITNPECSPEERNKALDLITSSLINLGKTLNIKKMFAFSEEPHIIQRSCAHGFGKMPFEFTILDLTKEIPCHS